MPDDLESTEDAPPDWPDLPQADPDFPAADPPVPPPAGGPTRPPLDTVSDAEGIPG